MIDIEKLFEMMDSNSPLPRVDYIIINLDSTIKLFSELKALQDQIKKLEAIIASYEQ